MSNVEHYALEAALKKRIDSMDVHALRKALKRLIDDGSINTVREIEVVLNGVVSHGTA